MKYGYDKYGNRVVKYEKCQFAYGMIKDKFDSIYRSQYGHCPKFLSGIKCSLFVVKEDGTHLSEYTMYFYNKHFYVYLGNSNRHVYAKYIYPEDVKELDVERLFK